MKWSRYGLAAFAIREAYFLATAIVRVSTHGEGLSVTVNGRQLTWGKRATPPKVETPPSLEQATVRQLERELDEWCALNLCDSGGAAALSRHYAVSLRKPNGKDVVLYAATQAGITRKLGELAEKMERERPKLRIVRPKVTP